VLAVWIIFGLLVAFCTMSWWMPRSWYRALLYPGGRPNALANRVNALSGWLSSLGVAPSLMVTLEVVGRRSGKISRLPLVVAEVDGQRYVVSMLGEDAAWVVNTRAANGDVVLRHGIVEQVRLQEVPASERAPILRAYLKRATGARPHIDIDPEAPLEEFRRVAPAYPVFRILPR
jgi:deazaflavin-dependent oxidoreductase (nitroreductase family)